MMKKLIITLLSLTLLTGCTLPGLGANAQSNDIVIAGGNTTERQILTEILVQMTQHYVPDVKVSQINNLGSTLLIYQALTRNDANVAGAMYTGTSLTGELQMDPITDPKLAMETVQKEYYKRYQMLWFPSYGFENSYAFMVTRKFAEENNLTKVSDFEKLSSTLKVGVDSSWIDRPGDGYESFKELYGFSFTNLYPMEIGLVYNAVQVDEMQAVLGYSTDGRIEAYDLVILEDDRNLFPPYDASPLLSTKLLEAHPELELVFLKLENQIPQDVMQGLNRKADELKIEPKKVAQQFLEENNYFESVQPTPLSQRDGYSWYQERSAQ